MKKIDIAFMADYGRHYGKGLEIEAISRECKKLDLLGDVYLREKSSQVNEKTLSHQVNVLPFGSFFFRILTAIQRKLLTKFRSRYWQEKLFDRFVSMILRKKTGSEIFYGVPRLITSFKKAKALGYTTVLHAAEMSAGHNTRVLKELYGNNQPPVIWDSSLLNISSETYKYIDYVIAHSEDSKRSYVESGFEKEKVFVTPMGFDSRSVKRKCNYKTQGITKFLYIGNITMMKGIHLIIEAWSLLNTSLSELHICGDIYEDVDEMLGKFVKENENVFYQGYVQPSEWFNECDVFIFPSLSEGFSRVVVEAAASGIPVVVSRSATDEKLFSHGENGFVIEPNSNDLAEKMEILTGDFTRIEQVGKSSAENFSALSWDNFGKNTADILSLILKG